MRSYTDSHLRSDFCFLEETSRVADNAARDITDRLGVRLDKEEPQQQVKRQWSVREQHLIKNCGLRGTRVKLMAKGMSRHERNKSMYHLKSKTIQWTIEFDFNGIGGSKITVLQHDIKETTTLHELLTKSLTPKTSAIPPEVICQLGEFTSIPVDAIHVYLRRENARANEPQFYCVDQSNDLKTILQDKHLVEFPTFVLRLTELSSESVANSKIKQDVMVVDPVVDVPVVDGEEEMQGLVAVAETELEKGQPEEAEDGEVTAGGDVVVAEAESDAEAIVVEGEARCVAVEVYGNSPRQATKIACIADYGSSTDDDA
ncbi:hypothetical protein HDU98_008119 [Podochytrium sp. JEL0797]|nr:hypothetical protein HDU98_008119 [Podochytrium sp. JEL0797]